MNRRFVTHLTQRETIDFLCRDLPAPGRLPPSRVSNGHLEAAELDDGLEEAEQEQAPLLSPFNLNMEESFYDEHPQDSEYGEQSDFASIFAQLNALEIAAVSDAKRFLSQKSIQQIVDGIWKGDIVFWETLGTHSKKEAKVYRKSQADPFCRLRVPLYLKAFEVLFFAAFLALYYVVLVQKHANSVTAPEVMLYVWLASFSYNGKATTHGGYLLQQGGLFPSIPVITKAAASGTACFERQRPLRCSSVARRRSFVSSRLC